MARLSRQESRTRTRELLLEAAGTSFARLGYGAASVDAIAEAAGYSKGALYSNFADKEAIFLELMRAHMAREQSAVEALVSTSTSLDQMLAGLEGWLEGAGRQTDWPLLAIEMQLHANRNPGFAREYAELNTAHRAALGRLVAELYAKAGKRSQASPEILAGMLMALSVGLVLQRPVIDDSQPSWTAGRLIRLVIEALFASAPPGKVETLAEASA